MVTLTFSIVSCSLFTSRMLARAFVYFTLLLYVKFTLLLYTLTFVDVTVVWRRLLWDAQESCAR